MKSFYTLLLVCFFVGSLSAEADICGIDLTTDYHASFVNGDRAEFTFNYSTDETDGVRIFGRPYTNGAATPGYGAHGSGLYFDDGTAEGWFTINSGAVIVDEIYVTIVTADQSEILRDFWIPVNYHFGVAGVSNFSANADMELASFLLSDQVTINYDYNIGWANGGRIFLRPFTDGALTPGYSASGSGVFTGEGVNSATFSVNSGSNVRVDAIRVRVVNPDQTLLLAEFFVPVNWYWSTVKLENISLNGSTRTDNGSDIGVNFDYSTTETDGVRIFPRPYTNGELTPSYAACGSSIYTGNGDGLCNFTINANNHRVDHIRMRAVNPDQNEILLEILVPANRYFGAFALTQLSACPPSPARLRSGEPVKMAYTFQNATSGEIRIFPRPFTEGALSSNYSASGSPTYPVGNGAGVANFTIMSEGAVVDQIRFQVTNNDQSTVFGNHFYRTNYEFGDNPVSALESFPQATEKLQWNLGSNPMNALSQLQLNSELRQSVDIQLVDLQGRLVYRFPRQELTAGVSRSIVIDRQQLGLAAGMYFLHIVGSDYQATERLVVK